MIERKVNCDLLPKQFSMTGKGLMNWTNLVIEISKIIAVHGSEGIEQANIEICNLVDNFHDSKKEIVIANPKGEVRRFDYFRVGLNESSGIDIIPVWEIL